MKRMILIVLALTTFSADAFVQVSAHDERDLGKPGAMSLDATYGLSLASVT